MIGTALREARIMSLLDDSLEHVHYNDQLLAGRVVRDRGAMPSRGATAGLVAGRFRKEPLRA